ncbi:PH domain-containing protein [Actinomadura sp. HBU206391]|uniref:PH domain-containing protein n=1 Tax=Actinomadura sp. HBU206391 TaxID=2731692 RepID=UPI00164F0666|nr:PH domain-containing protein [Actinomadura sp. HBU206391]MBC6457052.1 PH domain-containing protein [Actinomadura sp. HBU206391]
MIPPDVREPLVLRSSRKGAVLYILLVASVWCFIATLLWSTESGMWLLPFLTMVLSHSTLLFPVVFAVRGGDTVVDAHGVTRRRGRLNVHVPWDQVARISFKAGAIGIGHQLVLFRRSGRPVLLAAPPASVFTTKRELVARLEPIYARAGLHRPRVAVRPVASGSRMAMVIMNGISVLVLGGITTWALFFTSPWTQAWWPGRDEASLLPDACSVIDQGTIARLIPKAERPGHDDPASSPEIRSCAWGTDAPHPR